MEESKEIGIKRFYGCYLLASLSPRHKGHTYIGFTVNPRRRIRQHNGELGSGAWRTKSRRPWEMVLCIYGFPTNVSALQFEWAWQHPAKSLAVREAAANFKSFSGIANKIKLAYAMLTLPAWQSLNITVNYFSTKYSKHAGGCPSLPDQMKVHICPMDELPCYDEHSRCLAENENGLEDFEEFDEVDNVGSQDELIRPEAFHTLLAQGNNDDEQLKLDGPAFASEEHGGLCSSSMKSPLQVLSLASAASIGEETEEGKDNCTFSKESRVSLDWLEKHQPNSPAEVDEKQERSFVLYDASPDIEIIHFLSASCRDETEDGSNRARLSGKEYVELDQPTKSQSTSTMKFDQKQESASDLDVVSQEIEIIDLFTPSPGCRNSLHGKKKRRVSNVDLEVIDLTKSPVFVQL